MEKPDKPNHKRLFVAVLKIIDRDAAKVELCDDKCRIFAGGKPALLCPQAIITALQREGLVTWHAPKLEITAEGSAYLTRALALSMPMAAQHRDMQVRRLSDAAGDMQALSVNLNESPLAWLRKRKDASGKAMLSDAQFAAGEKLRHDFERAQLQPKITASWDMSRAQVQNGLPPTGDFSEGTLAAKARVSKALGAIGPELSGVLTDICCFLKTLSAVEIERRWPARSAKVVLSLALDRLSEHYGFAAKARNSHASIKSWVQDGARPTIQY